MRLSLTSWLVLASLPACVVDAAAQTATEAYQHSWVTTFNTEARYSEFTGTKGQPLSVAPLGSRGKGSQFYMPFAVSLAGQPSSDVKFEMTVRGGYVDSRQSTFGLSGDLQSAVDSQLSFTATYLGINGIQPFVSFNMNLPTGPTYLYGNRFLARLDPDLVDVPTFGEGFNYGGTLGANVPLGDTLLFTLSAGFTDRGAFTREGLTDPLTGIDARLRVSPGTSGTVTAALSYQEGPWTANIAALYSQDAATSIAGVPVLRTGHRFSLSGVASYAWNEEWSTTLNGSFTHSERNFVPDGTLAVLAAEPRNSNSNLYRIGLDTLYRTGSWALGPTLSYLYRDANSYSPVTLQFLPARQRYGAGGVVQYALTDSISLNFKAERIWVREEASPDKVDPVFGLIPSTGQPKINYNGFSIASGATIRF